MICREKNIKRTKINKCNKLLCSLYDKDRYLVQLGILKQTLNHGLKVHRVTQFNQKTWLK